MQTSTQFQMQFQTKRRFAHRGLILIALFIGSPINADVYRCEDPLRFQDYPCPNAQMVKLHAPLTMPFAKLTPGEKARLAGIGKARSAKTTRKRRPAAEIARVKCADANLKLRELKLRRRKGYRASEEARLDAERSKQESIERQYC